MTAGIKHTASRSRRAFSREFCSRTSRPPIRGRGYAGRPIRPIAACATIVVVGTRISQVTPEMAGHSPRSGFTAYFVLSRAMGFLSPSPAASSCRLNASVEASGPHDFTVRKAGALVFGAACVHRILPRVRDDLEPPLQWDRTRGYKGDLGLRKIRIFLQRGLDRFLPICPSGSLAGGFGPGRLKNRSTGLRAAGRASQCGQTRTCQNGRKSALCRQWPNML